MHTLHATTVARRGVDRKRIEWQLKYRRQSWLGVERADVCLRLLEKKETWNPRFGSVWTPFLVLRAVQRVRKGWRIADAVRDG